MFKQKYFVFLLFGLSLGIGLFLFIGRAISNDSTALPQDTEILSKPERLPLDGAADISQQPINQDEHGQVGSKNDETLPITKDRHAKLF